MPTRLIVAVLTRLAVVAVLCALAITVKGGAAFWVRALVLPVAAIYLINAIMPFGMFAYLKWKRRTRAR